MADERPALAVRPVDAEALYRTHVRPLYTFIYSKVGNRETAEDITSEVFTKALTHLDPTREEHQQYDADEPQSDDAWYAGAQFEDRSESSGDAMRYGQVHAAPPLDWHAEGPGGSSYQTGRSGSRAHAITTAEGEKSDCGSALRQSSRS